MPSAREHKVALIAGRTSDNPALFRAVIERVLFLFILLISVFVLTFHPLSFSLSLTLLLSFLKLIPMPLPQGCTTVYLEKPGAPSVPELEAMQALAAQKGVQVYMGYNKNVTKYVADALALESSLLNSSVAFYHMNTYKPEQLPECFSRNRYTRALCSIRIFF